MRKYTFSIILLTLIGSIIYTDISYAYWIWTPETKKFVNPKYAVKDTPKEQFEWAMTFYNAKDYQRAAFEFEKLAKQYEFSEYASKAQYYVGLCYEDMQKYYIAFENYQKAIDNFPHIANTEEILAREFAIGNIYMEKPSPKVLGTDIMAPLDRAVEVFKKVVENAPYGKYAEEAQFKLGEALEKSERYEEAVQAFHKLVDDYPNSKFATKAMYEESYCAYKASLKPAYDVAATDNAIKTFEKFVDKNKDSNLAKKADKTMKRLKDNIAEKSFRAAEFYESQGKAEAAIIYYQDVIDTYPDSSLVGPAKDKIEKLKNKSSKKKQQPIAPKVQAAPKVQEKKPWKPLSFIAPKKEAREATDTKTPEARKKSPWKPLSFIAKKEGAKKPQETPVAEVPKVEPQAPAVKVPEVIKETPAPKVQEAPKKKAWKPLNFDNRGKGALKEAPKKKEWKPLYFGTKAEAVMDASKI